MMKSFSIIRTNFRAVFKNLLLWTSLIAICWTLAATNPSQGSSLIYKNYVVRYDRGWDILCEPYMVQKDDWVLKIFRQKGEIAHKDFRDFLGIFQRLNPHIRNIDMIRPGQTIDIPLRKLEHGTLPGQATGVVTIPFVTLSNVMEVVQKHSRQYPVQKGDTVSEMIARHYGRYGSKGYQEGIKLFQAANPQVTDLDVIYAGQKVYLPDPAIRDQTWYAGLYDATGELKETLDRGSTPFSAATPGTSIRNADSVPEKPRTPLAQAAATVGGKLYDKGTYYLPRQGMQDFELDLSRYPMLDLPNEARILFAEEQKIMSVDQATFQNTWPDIKIAAVGAQAPVEEIIGAIFEALAPDETLEEGTEVAFSDMGVHVVVRAKWVKPAGDKRQLCITPIDNPGEQTPESILRYLEQNGIVLKEVMPGGDALPQTQAAGAQRHAVRNILSLAPANQKDFVQAMARALGLSYAPNVAVSFPYAGIQVKAYANLLSAGSGREVLIDFGELYGDAVDALRQSGPQLVQIKTEDSYQTIAERLLTALGLKHMQNPTFLAVQRTGDYNTAITVNGVLYAAGEDKRVLLSAADLHPAITDLLSASDVDVVMW